MAHFPSHPYPLYAGASSDVPLPDQIAAQLVVLVENEPVTQTPYSEDDVVKLKAFSKSLDRVMADFRQAVLGCSTVSDDDLMRRSRVRGEAVLRQIDAAEAELASVRARTLEYEGRRTVQASTPQYQEPDTPYSPTPQQAETIPTRYISPSDGGPLFRPEATSDDVVAGQVRDLFRACIEESNSVLRRADAEVAVELFVEKGKAREVPEDVEMEEGEVTTPRASSSSRPALQPHAEIQPPVDRPRAPVPSDAVPYIQWTNKKPEDALRLAPPSVPGRVHRTGWYPGVEPPPFLSAVEEEHYQPVEVPPKYGWSTYWRSGVPVELRNGGLPGPHPRDIPPQYPRYPSVVRGCRYDVGGSIRPCPEADMQRERSPVNEGLLRDLDRQKDVVRALEGVRARTLKQITETRSFTQIALRDARGVRSQYEAVGRKLDVLFALLRRAEEKMRAAERECRK